MKPSYEELEQKLAVSQREFRAADATIGNLQMQLEKLAAENAGLKAAINEHSEGFTVCPCCGTEHDSCHDDVCRALNETPATDAFVAGVKADGIGEWVFSRCCSGNDTTDEAIKFADALRNWNGGEA